MFPTKKYTTHDCCEICTVREMVPFKQARNALTKAHLELIQHVDMPIPEDVPPSNTEDLGFKICSIRFGVRIVKKAQNPIFGKPFQPECMLSNISNKTLKPNAHPGETCNYQITHTLHF